MSLLSILDEFVFGLWANVLLRFVGLLVADIVVIVSFRTEPMCLRRETLDLTAD